MKCGEYLFKGGGGHIDNTSFHLPLLSPDVIILFENLDTGR